MVFYFLLIRPQQKKQKAHAALVSALKEGDEIEVAQPAGSFYVDVDKEASNNYIAFAAGSGITPMLSIIKTHLLSEPQSTFKLFYLNRTVKSIIFKEEIERLKNQFFGRFQVFYFLTREQRDTLHQYLTQNEENATVTNRSLISWLSGSGDIGYGYNGYFYVKDKKALLPIYMISQHIVEKITKFERLQKELNK